MRLSVILTTVPNPNTSCAGSLFDRTLSPTLQSVSSISSLSPEHELCLKVECARQCASHESSSEKIDHDRLFRPLAFEAHLVTPSIGPCKIETVHQSHPGCS